jgi:hypothetical protein
MLSTMTAVLASTLMVETVESTAIVLAIAYDEVESHWKEAQQAYNTDTQCPCSCMALTWYCA